jgi:DNA-binding NarL/FixJ family response regulator
MVITPHRLPICPAQGRKSRLLVPVRKFFCDVRACARKIFVERIAPFAQPWARVTTRLSESVQSIGFATGGMLGARLSDRLGIRTCWLTILRRMMALPTQRVEQVVELGRDDFAFRRGRKCGTILVDMQSHTIIDLLPDRQTETAKAWMQAHPEIQLVSRDRGGDSAAAAREGAPQATQIADRFQLYKNLVEAVELTLARGRAEIRTNAPETGQQEETERAKLVEGHTQIVGVENCKPAPDLCTERERLARRAQRRDRYEQVMALRAQGLGNAQIARRVGLTARTLQNWQKKGSFPEAQRRRKRPSCFDPSACSVLSRWEQGCHNGSQLYREIKAQGERGQERQVHRFLLPLRKKVRIIQKAESAHMPLQDFSAKDAVWLFVRDPATLDEKEQATLRAICQASETAKTT